MKNKALSIITNGEFVTLTYFEEDKKKQMSVKLSDLPHSDDFMYVCAHLIDEFAKNPHIEYFKGKTVCTASNHPNIFKVGKIYEWKDGRTVGEDGLIHPTTGKLTSLDEIKNQNIKFIEIVED